MKFTFSLLFSFVIASAAVAEDSGQPVPGSLANLDERYGFRELKFEQSLKSCKDMVVIEEDGEMKFCTRKNESLLLSGAKLKSIEYGFFRGKFATVTVIAATEFDGDMLFKSLEADYGPGRKAPRNITKYYWFGQKVVTDYTSTGTGSPSFAMWSKPLQALRQAQKEEKTRR